MTEEKKRNAKIGQERGVPEPKRRATTVTIEKTYTRQYAKTKDAAGSKINRPTILVKSEPTPTITKVGGTLKPKNDKISTGQRKEEGSPVKSRKDESSPRDKKEDIPPKIKKDSILEMKSENLTSEDISVLNKMITRLYSQLEIDSGTGSTESHSPRSVGNKHSLSKAQSQSSFSSALRVKKIKSDETNIGNVIDRLKYLEEELLRRRTQKFGESTKIASLQNEIERLEKQVAEQTKQLDRFKGLQSITNKAKGKHVELIEERHQTEKKDMEIKIQALEKDLKKNVQGTMREKEDLESKVQNDFSRLRQEIFRLDSFLESENSDVSPRSSLKTKVKLKEETGSGLEMDDMFAKIKNIGNEIQILKESKVKLQRTTDERNEWESSYKDLEKEIELFCSDISSGAGFPMSEFESTESLKTLRTSKTQAGPLKWKLNKAKSLMINYVRKSEDVDRMLKSKSGEVEDTNVRLREVVSDIEEIYGHIKRHEASLLPESEISRSKGSAGNVSRDKRLESRREPTMNENNEESLNNIQKLDYVGKTIYSYESLIKVQTKAIKQYENDFEAIHGKLSRVTDQDKNVRRQKSTASKQVVFEDDVHIDAPIILKLIEEVNYELLQLREQNKEMKSGLNSISKAKSQLEEISKDLTDMCVQHKVSDELISESGEDDTISTIKKKMGLCRTEFSKRLEELQVKESKLKTYQSDVESIAKEVHHIFLNTLESSSDKKDNKKKQNEETVQPKLIIVQLKAINEHYTKLQEDIKKLKSILHEKDKELADKDRQYKHSESNHNEHNTRLQMQVTVREEELSERQKEIKALREEANQKNTENTRLHLELQSRYTSNLGKSDDEKIYLRNKIDDLQRKLENAEHNLSEALTEKFNLLSRISASAGTKLTDDNPVIANLSDPNRPTKLAEKYSELYDNEWTNAFETLTNQFYMEEKDAISCLLGILIKSFTFCQSLASQQYDEIFKVLLLLHVDGIAEPGFKEGLQKISKDTKKQVKDIRKTVAPSAGATVFGLYLSSDTKKSLTDEQLQACEAYVSHCVQLCWLMCVQDPPVNISSDVHPGDKYNGDSYRHYTQTGNSVEYLVWPALQLHINGPLLCKGVVQGKINKEQD